MVEYWRKRKELYERYGINFDFLYKEYVLRKIPIERMHVRDDTTLDYYCIKVRETMRNIQALIDSGEDDYIAQTCMKDYVSMLGNGWEKRIANLEQEIYGYYSKFIKIYDDEAMKIEQEKQARAN